MADTFRKIKKSAWLVIWLDDVIGRSYTGGKTWNDNVHQMNDVHET